MKKYVGWATLVAVLSASSFSAAADPWLPLPTPPVREYLPDSVLRIGDHVYLQIRGALVDIKAPNNARYDGPMEFDCRQKAVRLSYLNVRGVNRAAARIYGKSINRYELAGFTPITSVPRGDELLQWACALPIKKERLVNVVLGSGEQLFQFDANSVRKSGSLVTLWARVEYPAVDFDPPYNAPYDAKREFIGLDCAANKYKTTIGYDFTPENAITDGLVKLEDTAIPITADDDYLQIAGVVCKPDFDAESYQGIGGETARKKTSQPIDLSIDSVEVPPAVMATVRQLTGIVPARDTSSTFTVVQSLTTKDSASPSKIGLVLQPQKNGITRSREIYSPQFYVDRVFAGGIVQLKSKINSTRSTMGSVNVAENFSFKPFTWNAGADFSYQISLHQVPGTAKPIAIAKNCRIGDVVEASSLNSQLSGHAWPLSCVDEGGFKHQGFYIEQLQYALSTGGVLDSV